MKVLVVEDEETLADAIARGLRREGIAVDVAGDGGSALEKAATNGYDVVVLDRDLPVVHGDDVCRKLIASSPAPGAAVLSAVAAAGAVGAGVAAAGIAAAMASAVVTVVPFWAVSA